MPSVRGSMSTNTGTAPAWSTASAVATNVNAGTITWSPGPMPAAVSATWRAAVPLLVAMQCVEPRYLAHSRSRPRTSGANGPDRTPRSSTPSTAARSSAPSTGQRTC